MSHEKLLLARIRERDGEEAARLWQMRLQEILRQAPSWGLELEKSLGAGARGLVFSTHFQGEDAVCKIFAFPEEDRQIKSLRFWSKAQIAPNVLAQPAPGVAVLKRIKPGDLFYLSKAKDKDKQVVALLQAMQDAASPLRPAGSLSLATLVLFRSLISKRRSEEYHLFSRKEVFSVVAELDNVSLSNRETVIHGDFAPNLLLGQGNKPLLVDARDFLWGDVAFDAASWALWRKDGTDIEEGLDLCSFDKSIAINIRKWALFQAFDAAAALNAGPERKEGRNPQLIETFSDFVRSQI